MERKLFLQRLEQLAELKPIKPPATAKRREADGPEVIQRGLDTIVLDQKENETLAYRVKRLKEKSRPCEHCDRVVKDQTIAIRFLGYPEPHRRETCSTCRKTKNPETGAFDLFDLQANNFFTSYFRKRNK
jgi:hypothetical protein